MGLASARKTKNAFSYRLRFRSHFDGVLQVVEEGFQDDRVRAVFSHLERAAFHPDVDLRGDVLRQESSVRKIPKTVHERGVETRTSGGNSDVFSSAFSLL